MSEFIEMLRNRLAECPDEWVFKSNASRYHGHGYRLRLRDVMNEVDAIIAERDALKAVATPTPPRRLREYKGVTYKGGKWYYCDAWAMSAASLIYSFPGKFTDADHAALLALRDDPWETLEEVVMALHTQLTNQHSSHTRTLLDEFIPRIRAAAQEPTLTWTEGCTVGCLLTLSTAAALASSSSSTLSSSSDALCAVTAELRFTLNGREIDPTAPEFSIEVIVAKHHIVIDFEQREAHDACLEIWANAAPRDAMPEGWVIGQSSKNPQMRTRIDSLSKQQAALPVQPEEQLAVLAEADDDADDDDVTAEVTYSAVGDDDADLNSKASSFNVRVNSNSFDVL
jgi:hypothetical protein